MTGIEVLKQSMALSSQLIMGLTEDLRDHPMKRICDNGNHALWIMGHLAYSEADIYHTMTDETNTLAHWADLFRGGSTPGDDASVYPSYSETVDAFNAEHNKHMAMLDTMTDADLDTVSANTPEGMEPFLGTYGKCILVMSIHPWHHRGQLADIRCLIGRQPVFA
jgi:DinB family protein